MKKKILSFKNIIILLLLVFFATACEQWQKPKCANLNKCLSVFTENMTCEAPCWQGIEPGKTTIEEAMDILAKLDFLESYTYVNEKDQIFDGNIVIVDQQKAWLGHLEVINGTIVYMSFGGELSSTFGEAEKELASPQKVLLYAHFKGDNIIKIYNFDQGIAYGTSDFFSSFLHRRNRLDAKTPVNTLVYFDPVLTEELVELNFFTVRKFKSGTFLDNLQDWNGYGEPLELYHQVEIADF